MNQGELFRIEDDISERNDLSFENPSVVKKLTKLINHYKEMLPAEATHSPHRMEASKNWKMPK